MKIFTLIHNKIHNEAQINVKIIIGFCDCCSSYSSFRLSFSLSIVLVLLLFLPASLPCLMCLHLLTVLTLNPPSLVEPPQISSSIF